MLLSPRYLKQARLGKLFGIEKAGNIRGSLNENKKINIIFLCISQNPFTDEEIAKIMMFDLADVEKRIIKSKKNLRNLSRNFEKNVFHIKQFIEQEIEFIDQEKEKGNKIIPEINFFDLKNNNEEIIQNIHKRGCVIIRDVFDDEKMNSWNLELEKYIEENDYCEDQKNKAGIDQYFSDLRSGKPQIFGLYWSKTQVEIRQSIELDQVKRWLNELWDYKDTNSNIFDPTKELVYADRVRRREPGDTTLGLSPHCDAGSVERWIDKGYQKVYEKIFADDFENFNPFSALHRDKTEEIESPAVSHVFRTFQGWVALTRQGPKDGTLQLIPIAKSIAYILTRALLPDVPEHELCGSKAARALSVNTQYHSLLLKALTSISEMQPGDTVWWHPDVVHAVEDKHSGSDYSNVVYVGSTPYCEKNLDYSKKQLEKFLLGESPPDFAPENYEIEYKNRATLDDLTNLGKRQLSLEPW